MGMRPGDTRLQIPQDADLIEDEDELEPDEEPEGSEPPESGASEEEIPDEYFGIRLADIQDEAVRKQTYDTLQEANRVANRRYQEIAEMRKEAEAATRERRVTAEPEDSEEEDLPESDEELLRAIGLDPELLRYDELTKPLAALARRTLTVERELQGMSQSSEAEKWERNFFGTLESLEDQHGAIPYDRAVIEEVAVERNIYDPEALYWAIMGPVRAAATVDRQPKAPAKDAVRDLKRTIGTPRKARGGAKGATTSKAKPATLQEAFEQARQKHNVPSAFDPFAYDE